MLLLLLFLLVLLAGAVVVLLVVGTYICVHAAVCWIFISSYQKGDNVKYLPIDFEETQRKTVNAKLYKSLKCFYRAAAANNLTIDVCHQQNVVFFLFTHFYYFLFLCVSSGCVTKQSEYKNHGNDDHHNGDDGDGNDIELYFYSKIFKFLKKITQFYVYFFLLLSFHFHITCALHTHFILHFKYTTLFFL